MLLLLHVLQEGGYRSQVQELQPGGRLGYVGHVEGEGQLCWSCRNGSGYEGWVGGPLSQLPGQSDKDHSNLWNPCAVELGLSPTFSVTVHTGCPAHRNGNRESSVPPASEMFVLSRSLAVNDFLWGGSSPGTRSPRSASSRGMLCVLAATGCRELQPLLWGSVRAPSLQGRGSFPFPACPILPGGDPAQLQGGIQHHSGPGAPFWGA